MDKKAQKKIDKLRQQIQLLKGKIAGAKKQEDEPGEVKKYEAELAAAQAEVAKLQASYVHAAPG
jgi:peptidoglycan hydrolase CwlO-like protein